MYTWNSEESEMRERENKQYSLIVYSACSSISLINYIHFLMHSFHPLYFRERETIMNYIYFLTSISRSDPHYFRERERESLIIDGACSSLTLMNYIYFLTHPFHSATLISR